MWLAFDSNGKIDHPDDGSYTLAMVKQSILVIAGQQHSTVMKVGLMSRCKMERSSK